MNVSVGAHWEGYIAELVRSGRYGSASEVVRSALRLIEEREKELQALKETIDASIASGGSHSDEEVGRQIEEHLASRSRATAE